MNFENVFRQLRHVMRYAVGRPATDIDHYFRQQLRGHRRKKYSVVVKELPAYRFVDANNAVLRLIGEGLVGCVQTKGDEDLSDLLRERKPDWASRRISPSSRVSWLIGADQEVYYPRNQFWVFQNAASQNKPAIVHLEYSRQYERLYLEVAAHDEDVAAELMGWISKAYVETSIFRGQMLSVSLEPGTRDSYGDVEKAERLRVGFKVAPPVAREDFVIDELVFSTLWRNVVDLHRRRDLLKQHGVPLRRGVLLYGPPGTGKTYACRYVCGELPDVTRLLVSGSALSSIGQIFDIARAYQPALVVLEDVDLVFASREITLYSSALGDLLDQMDGLRPADDIGVILTTNSIERMEQAIKDRPGRISQCIYMGPPADDLRARYIAHHSARFDLSDVAMDTLVRMSRGATPAFIKEWVLRAVQIATHRWDPRTHASAASGATPATPTPLKLFTTDFDEAQQEMRRFVDGRSQGIIGFVDHG